MIPDRNTAKPSRLGIMGGTFDPIHYGHLVTAEAARARFNLDRVIFVPTGQPPHKLNQQVSSARHRYLMTVLATITNPFFEVSSVEIDRKGLTYTIDTVREFIRRFGDDTELFFITGADAVLDILSWREVDNLAKLCQFIAATRPGFSMADLNRIKTAIRACSGVVHEIEVPALAISSTDIRQRVKERRPIKYLVPESVEYYILKNGLYYEQNDKER